MEKSVLERPIRKRKQREFLQPTESVRDRSTGKRRGKKLVQKRKKRKKKSKKRVKTHGNNKTEREIRKATSKRVGPLIKQIFNEREKVILS